MIASVIRRPLAGGFTLMELVVVIVIAGILAAFAASKVSPNALKSGVFAGELRSAVRYAQKLAVAQRRNVFVVVNSGSVGLCYDAGCTGQVKNVSGSWFQSVAPSGASIGGATFFFDSLGRPNPGGALVFADSSGTQTITIEAESGFVH